MPQPCKPTNITTLRRPFFGANLGFALAPPAPPLPFASGTFAPTPGASSMLHSSVKTAFSRSFLALSPRRALDVDRLDDVLLHLHDVLHVDVRLQERLRHLLQARLHHLLVHHSVLAELAERARERGAELAENHRGFFAGGADCEATRVAADEATRGARRNASRGRGERDARAARVRGATRRGRVQPETRAIAMGRVRAGVSDATGKGRSLARGKEIGEPPARRARRDEGTER